MQAFDVILVEHGPMLSRICATYEADAGRRQELMQEVALAIWQALPSFRGEGSLKAFLARIAHNRGVSHVAREVRSPSGGAVSEDLPATTATPEHAVADSQMRDKLLAAVRTLPLKLRQVVSLALEGFSHREIAEALGISENNVAVRYARAKTSLKAAMAPSQGHRAVKEDQHDRA